MPLDDVLLVAEYFLVVRFICQAVDSLAERNEDRENRQQEGQERNARGIRQERDLSGRRGLVLSLRADGVYRLWLQLRDANPAGSDDGSETWLASLSYWHGELEA